MKSHKNLSSTLEHLERVQIIFRANFTYDMKLPQHGNSHLDQTVVQKMCPKNIKGTLPCWQNKALAPYEAIFLHTRAKPNLKYMDTDQKSAQRVKERHKSSLMKAWLGCRAWRSLGMVQARPRLSHFTAYFLPCHGKMVTFCLVMVPPLAAQ